MKSKKVFSGVLKSLKIGADVPWRKIAASTGITPSTLSGYVNGVRYPRDENYQKIAEFFGLTTEELRRLEALELTGSIAAEKYGDKPKQFEMRRFDLAPRGGAAEDRQLKQTPLLSDAALKADLLQLYQTMTSYNRTVNRVFSRMLDLIIANTK